MVFSNVIVDVTISRRSFVFGQSRAKVTAVFADVSSLAVAAFDLVYCSLSVLRFVKLRAVSYFSLQSYYTQNLRTRAAKPLATRNEGVTLYNNIVVCNRAG